MSTFKYVGRDPIEIPSLGIRVPVKFNDAGDPVGTTFEVPDEYAARFVSDPEFVESRTKSPDVVTDPAVAAAVTGTVPVIEQPPAS